MKEKNIIKNSNEDLNGNYILSEAEMNKILNDFNNTKSLYPMNKTIHELFEEQVDKTPDAIAVVCKNKKITYRQLNNKANQLARVLRDKGVTTNEIVAIVVDRSIEMIVCIMAVLKAGGAYLPIDPKYPKVRIEYMLKDSNSKLVLTQNSLINMLAALNIDVINVENNSIYKEIDSNLININKPNDLIYVIYTSGSTGKPKGVMIEHKQVNNFIHGITNAAALKKYKSVLCITTISFDIFGLETLVPLSQGLKIVVTSEDEMIDGKKLGNLIKRNDIEVMQSTPSRIKILLERDEFKDAIKGLKAVLIGGEEFPINLLQILGTYNNLKIFNVYGPTETTIWSCIKLINKTAKITIGKPINNTYIYILDKEKHILPVGVPGEIYISGDGLARGYLNRPDLTDEKFIDNPFIANSKMFKTGDIAKWNSNGDIKFLGRIDNQVKIRGHRIELGEIENKLIKHEYINEVVVLAKKEEDENKYLCAYIVAEKEIKPKEIRKYLSNDLPNYMIPSYIIQLKALPLTPNGKIDKKALGEMKIEVSKITEYVAPENDLQKKLVEIWEETLNIKKIGISNNFFDLGGHSLKAMMLVARIHKELDVSISVNEVFNFPTINEMSRYMMSLNKEKYYSLDIVEEKEHYELSQAQKRMFIMSRFNKDITNYNITSQFNLNGKLVKDRLKDAFKELIKRHESLRTSFHTIQDEPMQKIHECVDFDIEYHEFDNSDDEDIREKIDNMINNFIRPFDLSKAPLLRAKLIKIDNNTHKLITDIHHIISDGVSEEILISELIKLYRLEELPLQRIQYKDYVMWQKEQVKTEKYKKQEKYWTELFNKEVPILNMTTDYQRPNIRNFEGDSITFDIDNIITEKLKQISKENNATLYILLLTAYNILLHKYTGQEDIVIGSPIVGRTHSDLENVVGMFVNTLVMRNYPKSDMTFKEFLLQVKENTLKAFKNQDYQFDDLVSKLNIKRSTNMNPLFDTMFIMQTNNVRKVQLNDLKISEQRVKKDTSKFDITLEAEEVENGISFNLDYCTSLYKKETIYRLNRHFINLVDQIANNPEIKINEIDILTQEERNQMLIDFNNTKSIYPKDKTVHELFEEQAKIIPDEIAVVYEDNKITYKELNERANKLARTLRYKNIKNNDVVAIMIERSVEMIVCILSVLKAGGAYLPIDSKYPTTRKKYMLEDSKAKILLTQNILIDREKDELEIDTVFVDDEGSFNQDGSNLSNISNKDSLLYVIYTSGSTGKPKGVMIKNNNVINLVYGLKQRIYNKYQNKLNIALVAPYIFDASIKQIFPSLLLGHSLYIVPEDTRLSGSDLLNYYIKNSIEITDGTPMHIKMLSELKLTIKDTKLEEFLIGGESLSHTEVMNFLEKFQDNIPVITNVYGPTECCDITTVYSIDYDKLKHMNSIPIGKAIANVNIYIVDSNLNLQPIGVPGELCISGKGLSRGYLNSPELTEKKFINNPFNDGTKMYKTGDLVKWLPDGNIEYIGRMDNQVKIRGYRIELGEIKIVLEKFKSIQSAVVLVNNDESIGEQLVSYLVVREGLKIEHEELKNYVKSELPSYMIPTKFTIIDKIPITSNGKIDKKELLETKGEQINFSNNNEPSNWIEELMMNIWTDILKTEKIGVNDEFFELGGHSLLATRLISKIRSSFKVDLPIIDVFKYSTIASLSYKVQKEMEKGKGIEELEIKKFNYNNIIPLSFAQQRLWFFDQLEPNSPLYNVPKIIRMNGKLKLEALENSFNKIIDRHEIFRTTFKEINGEAVQVINTNKKIKLGILDLRSYPQSIVEDLAFDICKEKVKEVFDLTQGPLLKVNLIWLKNEEYILIINMHHIICDGWSIGNLLHELQVFYTAYIKDNKECLLENLPIQYADFTLWQKKCLKGEILEKGIEYWERKLSGKLPVLELANNDNHSKQSTKHVGAVYEFSISKQISDNLKDLSRRKGSTLFMTLLTAFKILLYRYTEQTDIIIGTPIANRNRSEIEKLIGFFVNTLVLRTDLSGNPTFDELLLRVREVALEAYVHQDIPFEKIVEKLKPERNADVSPLFQVMFSFQNIQENIMKLPELTLKKIEVHNESAKFDLDLAVEENKDGLYALIEYKTDLFDEKAIQSMCEDYQKILENIIKNPQQRISSITMCSNVVDLEELDLDDIFA